MKDIFGRIQHSMNLEKLIVRFIMAWILTAIIFLIKTETEYIFLDFTYEIDFWMYGCFIMLFFFFFCALAYFRLFNWIEAFGPLILLTIYGCLTIIQNQELNYIIALAIFIGIASIYAIYQSIAFLQLQEKGIVLVVYILVVLVYVFTTGSLSVFKYLTYHNGTYDIGIWGQMFYYMEHTFTQVTTCERNVLMSHFSVHFSPIYYIYLPIYYLFPTVITLQILQVITIISGIIPIYLLCKHFNLSKSATMLFGVLFALYPALTTGCFYDLHENCFLVPFLLWLFYFIEKNNIKGVVIFVILTCLVKEDSTVYLGAIGLFWMMGKKQYKKGFALLLSSIFVFLGLTYMIGTYGLGIQTFRYSDFMNADGTGGLTNIIRVLLVNPGYFIYECFQSQKIEYMVYTILPLGFLPLITKKISKYILFIPMIFVNLASSYEYQYSIYYQYTFGVLAILFYLSISNYSELSKNIRSVLGAFAISITLILFPINGFRGLDYMQEYVENQDDIKSINLALESIPKEASVTSGTYFLPHLTQRDELYRYPSDIKTDYVILDLRDEEITELDLVMLTKQGYKVIREVEDLYIIMGID